MRSSRYRSHEGRPEAELMDPDDAERVPLSADVLLSSGRRCASPSPHNDARSALGEFGCHMNDRGKEDASCLS
jgi:hypothetical protein